MFCSFKRKKVQNYVHHERLTLMMLHIHLFGFKNNQEMTHSTAYYQSLVHFVSLS